MDLYYLTVKWAGNCLFCNKTDGVTDPIEIFELFHVFIQPEHAITNIMGVDQVDIIAFLAATDLVVGGTNEVDITRGCAFDGYFQWVLISCWVLLTL